MHESRRSACSTAYGSYGRLTEISDDSRDSPLLILSSAKNPRGSLDGASDKRRKISKPPVGRELRNNGGPLVRDRGPRRRSRRRPIVLARSPNHPGVRRSSSWSPARRARRAPDRRCRPRAIRTVTQVETPIPAPSPRAVRTRACASGTDPGLAETMYFGPAKAHPV